MIVERINLQTSTKVAYMGRDKLLANERSLKNYNMDIIKKINKGLSNSYKNSLNNLINHSKATVCEFGAGIGTLASEYTSMYGISPDCVEIDPVQIQIIKDRGYICVPSLTKLSKKYDAIYTSNVLEHIEDDVSAINQLHDHLIKGGRVAIYVPALMCLYNQMDSLVGHYRRYSRKELRSKVALAGFKILSCHYVDSIGFFAWLYLSMKRYKQGDLSASNNSLAFFDQILWPISKALDLLGCRFIFGKNLLLIAEKTTD